MYKLAHKRVQLLIIQALDSARVDDPTKRLLIALLSLVIDRESTTTLHWDVDVELIIEIVYPVPERITLEPRIETFTDIRACGDGDSIARKRAL